MFKVFVRAKWVLSGEHSVLRGGAAIALPHPELGLELSFRPGADGRLVILPESASAVILDILRSIQEERQEEGYVFGMPSGVLEIKSTIPIGAGLGSSAALCVAIARWLSEPLRLRTQSDIQQYATRLEHRFHGRSSGMDVAVIAADEPISFVLKKDENGATPLGIKKVPHFTFHDTGLRTRTSECVIQVEKFRESDPRIAMEIDEKMSAASRRALEGLIRFDSSNSSPSVEALALIADGMKQAQQCFYAWRLVPGEAKRMEEDLLSRGALAVKITGAGGGGMLVALWPDKQ